jgi:hypothetical protein
MTGSRSSELEPSALSIRDAPAPVLVVLAAAVAIALAYLVSTVPGMPGRPGTIPF